MILFHHRALIGCLAWTCTRTVGVKTRYAAITPRGKMIGGAGGSCTLTKPVHPQSLYLSWPDLDGVTYEVNVGA